mmetsp:Transcript_85406/g.160812  ORF Transcript_85406/g.160812 Transcript_85406/m.160812 type:complete len:248 (-) Transcript_85406:128-871(-)
MTMTLVNLMQENPILQGLPWWLCQVEKACVGTYANWLNINKEAAQFDLMAWALHRKCLRLMLIGSHPCPSFCHKNTLHTISGSEVAVRSSCLIQVFAICFHWNSMQGELIFMRQYNLCEWASLHISTAWPTLCLCGRSPGTRFCFCLLLITKMLRNGLYGWMIKDKPRIDLLLWEFEGQLPVSHKHTPSVTSGQHVSARTNRRAGRAASTVIHRTAVIAYFGPFQKWSIHNTRHSVECLPENVRWML